MIKLYKYELYRLLFNKFFLGLLMVTMFYSYLIMDSEIVLGVANTAPFSSWSYGAFIGDVLPLLLITLLFFITFLYSPNEKKVQTITDTMPIDPAKYCLVRCTSIITGFVIIAIAAITVSLMFYASVFHFTSFGGFIAPALLVLIPAMLLILGLGIALGKLHPVLVYVLIPVILLLTLLPLPNAADLFGSSFFSSYPATLNVVEPPFSVPLSVLIGKVGYLVIGSVLTLFGVMCFRKRNG